MRVVVVVAHPDPDSFNHAIASTACAALTATGHEVTVLDLYAEEFRTAMSPAERRAYHSDRPILDPMAERHAEIVKQAEALVFIYPDVVEHDAGDPEGLARAGHGAGRRIRVRREQPRATRTDARALRRRHLHLRRAVDAT